MQQKIFAVLSATAVMAVKTVVEEFAKDDYLKAFIKARLTGLSPTKAAFYANGVARRSRAENGGQAPITCPHCGFNMN